MPAPDAEALQRLLGPTARFAHLALTGKAGIALAPLIDHHVHLHLVDSHALAAHGVAAVVDLGGDPAFFARYPHDAMPRVSFAGAFLTVPGGYPTFRPWAPAQVVRMVTSPSTAPGTAGGARTLVDEMADAGASVVKISLHADAGPMFDDQTLRAVIASARERQLPVVAHVEGDGMTRRAVAAGVDVIAHVPFTEDVDDETIAAAVAIGQRWISTLAVHDDPQTALANVARFAAAGGTVLYGTDLGNGDRPSRLDPDELRLLHGAGVTGPALVAALTDPWPRADADTAVATFVAGPPPASADDIPDWFGSARVTPAEELITHD